MDDRSDTVIKLEQADDHQSVRQTDKSANRAVNHTDTIKLEQTDNLQPIGQADNIKERANDRQSVGRTDKSVNRTVNHADNLQPIGQTDDASSPTGWDVAM